jgi:hypothetical protein
VGAWRSTRTEGSKVATRSFKIDTPSVKGVGRIFVAQRPAAPRRTITICGIRLGTKPERTTTPIGSALMRAIRGER